MKKLLTILGMVGIVIAVGTSTAVFVLPNYLNKSNTNNAVALELLRPTGIKSEVEQKLANHDVFQSRQEAVDYIKSVDAWTTTGVQSVSASVATGVTEASIKIHTIILKPGYDWSAENPNPSFDLPIQMDIQANIEAAVAQAAAKSYDDTDQAKDQIKQAVDKIDGVTNSEFVDPTPSASNEPLAANVFGIRSDYIVGVTTPPETIYNATAKVKTELDKQIEALLAKIANEKYATPSDAEEQIKSQFNAINGIQKTTFKWTLLPTSKADDVGKFSLVFELDAAHKLGTTNTIWSGSVHLRFNIDNLILEAENEIHATFYDAVDVNTANWVENIYESKEGVLSATLTWKDQNAGKYKVRLTYQTDYISFATRDSYVNVKTDISDDIQIVLNTAASVIYDTDQAAQTAITDSLKSLKFLKPNELSGDKVSGVLNVTFNKNTTDSTNTHSYYVVTVQTDTNYFKNLSSVAFLIDFTIKLNLDLQIQTAFNSLTTSVFTTYADAKAALVGVLNPIQGIIPITTDNVVRKNGTSDQFVISLTYLAEYYALPTYEVHLRMDVPTFNAIAPVTLSYKNSANPSQIIDIYGTDLSTNIAVRRTSLLTNLAISLTGNRLTIQATENVIGTVREQIELYLTDNLEVTITFEVIIEGSPMLEFQDEIVSNNLIRYGTSWISYSFKMKYYDGGLSGLSTNVDSSDSNFETSIILENQKEQLYTITISAKSKNVDVKKDINILVNSNIVTTIAVDLHSSAIFVQPVLQSPSSVDLTNLKVNEQIIYKFEFSLWAREDSFYLRIYDKTKLIESKAIEGTSKDTADNRARGLKLDAWYKEVSNENNVHKYELYIMGTEKNSGSSFLGIWGSQYVQLMYYNGNTKSDEVILFDFKTIVKRT